MKILDIPQSGKRGLTVSQQGAYGQISRALAIPSNPRSADQLAVRQRLAAAAEGWRSITEDQRVAWNALAKTRQSKARLGQSGPMSGFLLFVQVNANLALVGQNQVTDPPALPAFPALAVSSLTASNTNGTFVLSAACPTSPGNRTLLRASAPMSAGRFSSSGYRFIGVCPAPASGAADITSLYVAKFGKAPAGTKVFLRANQMVNGLEDVPREFSAIVGAGSA